MPIACVQHNVGFGGSRALVKRQCGGKLTSDSFLQNLMSFQPIWNQAFLSCLYRLLPTNRCVFLFSGDLLSRGFEMLVTPSSSTAGVALLTY